MTIQCERVPRGASWKPKPFCSPFGKVGGLQVVVSPLPMFSISAANCACMLSLRIAQRIVRAPMRPIVECRAPTPTFAPASELTVSRTAPTYFFAPSWPAATMQSTFASGPTCAGSPLKVGLLTQEYFPPADSVTLACQSAYRGTVSSSQGCFVQSPSYQECLMLSATLSRK